ncbi:YciI family protein [Actinomadura sp. KC06]|uniref:YciI family protein n=1 Tax=Actinomadura sp. KC06 TaxID=2530369 RepID=UPI0010529714|nr:YciI family protein [Actinomadura sp. KC06]TDD20887.1 YciI family protein [Actinomadura sp. KC06]
MPVHYVVLCRDVPDSAVLRRSVLDEHRRYVDERADLIKLSGPLLGPDGTTRRGQLFVLDVPDRQSAEAFISADPFTRAGVFATVDIDPLLPIFGNGRRT